MTEPTTSLPTADVIALPDQSFRLKRYLIVLMLVGMGLWFCYDGFYNWPKQAREAAQLPPSQQMNREKPHSDRDIFLNQLLGITLPIVGVLALVYFLHNSRGEYRLSGHTLHVPSHDPIPVGAITLIDKSKWERKGVARIQYERAAGKTGQFRLDNFVYQEEPTRLILKRLEEVLFPEEPNPPAAENPKPESSNLASRSNDIS
jgi:hypothetical protein